MNKKSDFHDEIRNNIVKRGFHITLVTQGVSPRYAYTIGLREKVGFEYILAGCLAYLAEDVVQIISEAAARSDVYKPISVPIRSTTGKSIVVRTAHSSWVELLALGANEYYNCIVDAVQIYPFADDYTFDVPDMSRPWAPETEPVWQWLKLPWTRSIPAESTAVTNLAALRGGRVTEAARWEEGEWELFCGPGPEVTQEDMRVAPFASFLAFDPTLDDAASLAIGKSIWRSVEDEEWHSWK